MKKSANHKTGHVRPIEGNIGFTLIELILATAISALVIGILSVCLSFSLRAWESVQNRKPDQSAALVDLLKRQLAEFDPTPIKFDEGPHPFFSGHAMKLAFATTHSVKAISRGVPVIARYHYDPGSKVLYYAEMPLDPYHTKGLKEFTQIEPTSGQKSSVRFFAVEIADFNLSYAGKDTSQYSEAWDQSNDFPTSVLMKWSTPEIGGFSQALAVNSPFSIEITKRTAVPVGRQ